ncbi:MAG TPA: DUF4157 domain-containing protein [Kofleriaceae bacterium]|nr:DUF4157 domain-containing protein [Kofleriaceae bacterium]
MQAKDGGPRETDNDQTRDVAARGVASGGSALPHLGTIQESFGRHGAALDGVSAHVGGDAATAAGAIGAKAYATGDRIAFASSPDLHLAAHEAAHVVQQRGGVSLKGGVGASGDAYERHADRVADAVTSGRSAEAILDAHPGTGSATSAVQRFDAGSGGHQGIERTVAGVDVEGGLGHDLKKNEPKKGEKEQGVNAIYSGNYMQDFSQMHAVFVHEKLKELPTRPVDYAQGKKTPTIGDAGAEALTDSVIRALAILDVGPELADSVVKGNMQAYRPEQHVDQPMGYRGNTDIIVPDQGTKGPLRPAKPTVSGGDQSSKGPFDIAQCSDVKQVADYGRDNDPTLKGSAVGGSQIENKELYKISDAGLQNHIYNSVEWTKGHWLKAVQKGPTDEGRFHVGAGLHVIEDYFAHSNFIEVAMNGYIDFALAQKRSTQGAGVQSFLGQVQADEKKKGGVHSVQPGAKKGTTTHVDTLFDAKTDKKSAHPGRQAITTGSVSGTDMKSSIGHILLAKAPMLQKAIDGSIEKIFGLVINDPSKASSWQRLKAQAKSDRAMAAVLALGDGADNAGMTVPVPTGVHLTYGHIEIPVPFVDNPTIPYPNGFKPDFAERKVTQAVGTYVGAIEAVHDTIETIKETIKYIKYLSIPGYAIVKGMEALIAELEEWIKSQLELLKAKVKQQIALGMVAIIDSITGHDSRGEVNRTIGDAIADAGNAVEGFEHETSLEGRLLDTKSKDELGGLTKEEAEAVVGPVHAAPGGGWIADNPLPPSHSEIAKDHSPLDLKTHPQGNPIRDAVDVKPQGGPLLHPDQHQTGAEHEESDGSIFYGLARALAVEADRHVLGQFESIWADRGSLYGDGSKLDKSQQEVGDDAFGKQADARAAQEEKRTAASGMKHAQEDPGNAAMMAKPGVRGLMNTVDLILAHPDDSTWWKTIFDDYINGKGHADEVARHIRERNSTRGNRRKPGG